MKVEYGNGQTQFGPGVLIRLTGDEVAIAIDAYLVAHRIHVDGPRTIRVNHARPESASVYVDPSGFAIDHNTAEKFSGRGPETKERAPQGEAVDEVKITGSMAYTFIEEVTGLEPGLSDEEALHWLKSAVELYLTGGRR